MGHLSHHPFSTPLEEELWAPNCSGHSNLLTSGPTLSLIRHNLLPTDQPERPSCQVSYIMSLLHSLSLSASQHTCNPTPHPYHGPLGSLWPGLHKVSTLPSPLCTRHPAPCCSLSTWTTCWPQAVSISWPLCLKPFPLIPTWLTHPSLPSAHGHLLHKFTPSTKAPPSLPTLLSYYFLNLILHHTYFSWIIALPH